MNKLGTLIIAAVMLAAQLPAQKLPKDFDSYVENVRKQFSVPGIAVAVVKDGKVVLAKGYGTKNVNTGEKVDAKTNFSIASNTKAFTATALGILVDEGKLKWTDRVIDHLPWFQMSDPYVSREMQIIDLLVHRSGLGLGAGDLMIWPDNSFTRKDIVAHLRNVPLSTSFRSSYAYDNILYFVAGEVIEQVSGMPWEQFIQQRILSKLGMDHSTIKYSDAVKNGNYASPHAEISGVVRPVTPSDSDRINPAASINTNADDIAKWLICQLDSGRTDKGNRLFSTNVTKKIWSIVTPVPVGTVSKEIAPLQSNFIGYGGGFYLRDFRGEKMVMHTGGLNGSVSLVAMIPELRLGVAVFTNQEMSGAFYSIGWRVFDSYLGEKFDWLSGYYALKERADSINASKELSAMTSRDSLSHPSLPLEKYAGTYSDPWYGDITLSLAGGKLFIQMNATPVLHGTLEHYQYDTFIARWDNPELRADSYITFSLHPDGSIDHAAMKAVSPATDFSYDFQDLYLKPKQGK
ncbi:MAG: serine hydrolase [Bacteroidota bacterium]